VSKLNKLTISISFARYLSRSLVECIPNESTFSISFSTCHTRFTYFLVHLVAFLLSVSLAPHHSQIHTNPFTRLVLTINLYYFTTFMSCTFRDFCAHTTSCVAHLSWTLAECACYAQSVSQHNQAFSFS